MSKRYVIEQLNDILNIPEESFDDFVEDLRSWYELQRQVIKTATLIPNSELKPGNGMTWIDDGKHDITLNLKVTAK